MEEIAQQFKEELQELLDRYKDKLTTPQIMRIAQPIFTKTIGFKDNPERFEKFKEINGIKVPVELVEEPSPEFKKMTQGEFIAHPPVTNKWSSEHNTLQGEFRYIDELEGSASHNAVTGIDLDSSMMHLGGSDA